MASTINSTGTSSGIVSTADASGVLNLQGGGNTGISISATGVPTITTPTISGVMTGVGSNSVTTFLGADVALGTAGGSFVSGPNTGSIGSNGEIWLIMAVACVNNTNNSALYEVALYNGSAYIANSEDTVCLSTAYSVTTIMAVVTLTAATTYTLRARAITDNFSNLKTTGGTSGVANKATSITAVRLA